MGSLGAVQLILCAAISTAEPEDSSASYRAQLREVLEVQPFEEEVSGADFALRALVVPSFHTECAVTVVRRGAETGSLRGWT